MSSSAATACFSTFFDAFLGPLEAELMVKSSERAGRAHGIADQLVYTIAHRCDELRIGRRRRRGDRGLRPRGRDPDRRVAVGQDPTCIYMAHAVRRFRGELSIHGGRFRIETIALDGPGPHAEAVRPDHRTDPFAADPQRTAAGQPLCVDLAMRIRGAQLPRTCCTGTASTSSTRPSPRSRKSRAASSTARASSAGSVPSGIGAPRRVLSVAWFTVAPKPCAIVER